MNAAGCIIICNNSVLLARRIEGKHIPFSGYWSIFAGSREPESEPPRICAIRELYEETGIKLKASGLKFASSIFRGKKILDLFYYKFDSFPEVNLNFEHTEYGWFNITELKSFPYLIDNKIIDIIQSIDIS
jgi:8-oxo-dGTP pyrophosphatase MutT (NUDIX family)